MENRGLRQRVVLDRVFSNWMDVLSGIPPGSVLGPIQAVGAIAYQ